MDESPEELNRDALLTQLRSLLLPLVDRRGLSLSDIQADSSLIDDLELDSLKFVDLMSAIESELGIEEFPMQSWVDGEIGREGKRFTVTALADACRLALAAEKRRA